MDESEFEQPAIGRLPIPTRIRLRSTQILTALPQVVSELLQNSLDAGAGAVEIGVDCEEWTCWVKDDGCGISKAGLELLGSDSEEGRYGTSKAYNSRLSNAASTFGFRGEALASAADVCCLEISSRTVNSRETWSIISKGGKGLYNGPAVRWKRERPGTTVCIRDAFYNLPVRRRSHPSPSKTLEMIRREIESYALVFPEVAFTLQNTNRKSEQGASVFQIPTTRSTLSAFKHLYGRALIEHVDEIHAKSGDYQIDGFISLIGAHSKAYQYLYINKHPMSVCELHQTVDSRFNESSFNKNALDEKGDTTLPRSSTRRSPRKTEKKPIYVLNLTIPPDQVDNCLEPSKSFVYVEKSTKVLSFLSSVVQDFLERNRFTTPNITVPQGRRSTIFASPRKRRKYDFDDDSGYAEDLVPFEVTEEEPIKKSTETKPLPRGLTHDHDVFWSDNKTGGTLVIDPRTGHSYAQKEASSSRTGHSGFGYLPGRRTLRPSVEAENPSGDQMPEWIQTALKSNQVYSVAEKNIRSLCKSMESQNLLEPRPDRQNCHSTLPKGIWNGDSGSGFAPSTHKLQKADLRSASVVGQIDRKFVACLIRYRPYEGHGDDGDSRDEMKTSLVIVDQHAADERVRVEHFLKELCLGYLHSREGGNDPEQIVQVKRLSPPLPLLLTRDEGRRLKRSTDIQAAFRHWGFHFDLAQSADLEAGESPTESGSAYTQVFLQSIPEMVGEKLLLGEELRDLVKGFLGQLETDLPAFQKEAPELSNRPKDNVDELRWLQALRWCPRELVALVNSKACRGAIMFNDPLTMEQCERLVQQLSDTAFPFQCAHGRPSLIPLLDLTVQDAGFSRDRRKPGPIAWWRLEEEKAVSG